MTATGVARLFTATGPASGSLYDVRDPRAFVVAAVVKSGVPGDRDDLIAEGLAVLCDLARRFDPHREGYERPGSFSAYAGTYLPKYLRKPPVRDRAGSIAGGEDFEPEDLPLASGEHEFFAAIAARVDDPLEGASDGLRAEREALTRIAALAPDPCEQAVALRLAVEIERHLRREEPGTPTSLTGLRSVRCLEAGLMEIQDYTLGEIAERLGCSKRTVANDLALFERARANSDIPAQPIARSASAPAYPQVMDKSSNVAGRVLCRSSHRSAATEGTSR